MDFTPLLEEAADIAEEAAEIAHSYFRQALLIELKENHTPVTIADKKAEEYIRNRIAQRFPSHGMMGEEFGNESAERDFVWTIDPIDGTRSFVRGIPLYGTLLGLMFRGEPILGVMVMPELEETYSAAKGTGAFCNGHQIHVSSTQTLENAMLSAADFTTFEAVGKSKLFNSLMECSELARTYTDCFAHSLVLRGSMDAMIDPIISTWDVAPIACLVKEAGGVHFDLNGGKTLDSSFVTCTPAIHQALLDVLQSTT
jgi:histidinol-phosphatase